MTDMNKLRSEFEAVTDIYHCIYNTDLDYYFSGSKFVSDKAEIEVNAGWKAWKKAKAQAVPDTKPIAYKVSFDSWQRQHGKDYFEFWKPDEFEDYKPDYLIPLYSFPTISSDFVVVPKEPTQKMLNAAHCYMNPVKGSDVHPETNRKRREMYKAMVKASESGAEG
ncbi:Uncharacterised protein [Acinetobacter baumannii]|nr:hypothetical protein [Acinetobacter baumannii]SSU56614.1 Uncharacterised protein [Acinetobacter baumannii]SSU61124.1 Uncharacterised protein [Acinetobacter baumannii]SSU90551.1 Uncharacterised protein [Acinetobacter baumannii]